MTELQSALLLRRQLAGERRGAGPRWRTDEPARLPSPAREAGWRRAVGRQGGSLRVSAGRLAGDTSGPAVEGVGGGDAPQPRPRTGRAPRAAAPSPTGLGRCGGGAWVPAGPTLPEGRIPGAQVRPRPRDLRQPRGACGAPRACESEPRPRPGPERGGAPNFWPGGAGSAELGQTTKATAGPAWGDWRGAPRARRGARLRFACLRLARARGCAARLGEGGRGR